MELEKQAWALYNTSIIIRIIFLICVCEYNTQITKVSIDKSVCVGVCGMWWKPERATKIERIEEWSEAVSFSVCSPTSTTSIILSPSSLVPTQTKQVTAKTSRNTNLHHHTTGGTVSDTSGVAGVSLFIAKMDDGGNGNGNRNGNGGGGGGFVRADQIDLKSIDEQLQRHLSRAWTMEKQKKTNLHNNSFSNKNNGEEGGYDVDGGDREIPIRYDWEIDPSKLIIKSVIARGTFGTVHRGIYDALDVAVKLLDWGEEGQRSEAEIASLRSAFTQEVSVWHKLEHPNVTKFIGATMGTSELNIQTDNGHIGMPRNMCCVVVEYLPGGTLKSYLIKNRRRKLAFKVVIQLALDLARGLNYLHSKKIVHRDVKTENMLLDKTRTVKIADFGVARIEASNPNDMTGETGTLGYMAPEVLNGSPYNRKCDVYSFSICLWEIYCCDMPYPDLSFSEVTSAVVRQNLRPEIPRCCPSSLANVMKRCWDANPDKRPEMEEAVSMLEAIDTSRGGGMIPLDQQQGCFCFRKYRGP